MRTKNPSRVHDARQAIINAGSAGVDAKRLAIDLGVTWHTLKTLVSRLRKDGFAVAWRKVNGAAFYFMAQFAPPSKEAGGARPKSRRVTCEQFMLERLQAADPIKGLTYADLGDRWKKSSLAKAVETLKFTGRAAAGRWSACGGPSVIRVFPSAEALDRARAAETLRRAVVAAEVRVARAAARPKKPRSAPAKVNREANAPAAAPKREPRRAEAPRGPARMTGEATMAPGARIITAAAPMDSRFEPKASETNFLFSALGPGRYMRHENAIARAYPQGGAR